MDEMTIPELTRTANHVRQHVLEMINAAGSGHPGGSLSAVDIVVALYCRHLRFHSDDPKWPDRDRVYWSKGHVAPLVYTINHEAGYIPESELCTLRQLGSSLQGHPAADKCPCLEVSSGSLGQGLSIGVGTALGLRLDGSDARVYCIMGDGEQQEGQIWEGVMSAAHFGLDHLCGIVDVNRLQIDGFTKDVMNIEPLADKYRAFNWNVIEFDGHEMQACMDALEAAKAHKGAPTVLLAHTVKGKGVSFMENVADWHGKCPNADELALALQELRAEEAAL